MAVLGLSWPVGSRLGGVSRPSWGFLGAHQGRLGGQVFLGVSEVFWAVLGPCWAPLWPPWGHVEGLFGPSKGVILERVTNGRWVLGGSPGGRRVGPKVSLTVEKHQNHSKRWHAVHPV
eukprot:6016868-Pyramimonas_sp.AAC.1